jgi:hypothetical protein
MCPDLHGKDEYLRVTFCAAVDFLEEFDFSIHGLCAPKFKAGE